MSVRNRVSAALLLAALVLSPASASAINSSDAVLSFGASYVAPDGSSCTHRGLDVLAEAGSSVEAPLSGSVRFAGRVPGPHGGTVGAVTLETAEGQVSMLPLDDIHVSKGDAIERGDALGSVSASGDPSTSSPHIHLSLRHGDLYVDPAVLLTAPPAPNESPAEEPETATAPDPAPSPAPAVGSAPALSTAPAPATGSSRAPSEVGSPASGSQQLEVATAGSMGEGVSLVPDSVHSTFDPAGPSVVSRPSITADIPSSERVSRIALESGRAIVAWLRSAGTSGLVAISVGLLACFGLLSKRAFERRVASNPPVSDRLGKLLQQLRAGDTLRGLTSCCGFLPSQSRSRLAQRR